jgi:DNA-binding PadR family transcriptional regulator
MYQESSPHLENWESVYKKGLLTFWILLLLRDKPSYPYEISDAVHEISQGTVSADENSIYRAIARFEAMKIVVSETRPSSSGPPRKYYRLTESGQTLLRRFIQRNILVFKNPQVAKLINQALKDGDKNGP